MAYLQHLLSKIGVAFLLMDRSDLKGDTLPTPYLSCVELRNTTKMISLCVLPNGEEQVIKFD